MIILGYVGDHKKDAWHVRLGWALTRLVQRGTFERVTHVEGFYGIDDKGMALIGSSSLRDGGVRTKRVKLDPENWIAVDVPAWNEKLSLAFIRAHSFEEYDKRGAIATVFMSGQDENRWFCNELVGASVGIIDPDTFKPSQFMALAVSMPQSQIIPLPTK